MFSFAINVNAELYVHCYYILWCCIHYKVVCWYSVSTIIVKIKICIEISNFLVWSWWIIYGMWCSIMWCSVLHSHNHLQALGGLLQNKFIHCWNKFVFHLVYSTEHSSLINGCSFMQCQCEDQILHWDIQFLNVILMNYIWNVMLNYVIFSFTFTQWSASSCWITTK